MGNKMCRRIPLKSSRPFIEYRTGEVNTFSSQINNEAYHQKKIHNVIYKMSSSRLLSQQSCYNPSKMKNLNSLSEKEKNELFESIDTVLMDCDGVLWLENSPINGAIDVVNQLKFVGKSIYFLTNNSTKSRKNLYDKSISLGFKIEMDEMITSAWLAAVYLKSIKFSQKVYVVGVNSINEELSSVGIPSIPSGPDPYVSGGIRQDHLTYDPDVGAVIVGHDIHFSYPKMVKASNYLRNENCLFIGTNLDPVLPIIKGNITAPGAGSFVNAIKICAERDPIITGKPSRFACDQIIKMTGIDPKRSLMIGDRCTTDIAFGNECNMKTLLVLSGVDNLKIVETYKNQKLDNLIPTYYSDSIVEMLKIINSKS